LEVYVANLPVIEFQEGENGYLIRGIEAFKAGVWRGETYTVEHLKMMEENFKKLKEEGLLEPPMKVDHSESARDTIGWIVDLYVKDDALYADALITEKEAYEKIQRGTWKKVSAEIYKNYREESNGKVYGMVFRALSVVSIPHLKNIKGIVLNSEDIEELKESDTGMDIKQLEQLLDAKLASLKDGRADFSEVSTKLVEGLKTFYKEEVEAYKEEAKKANEKVAELETEIKTSKIKAEVNSYAEAGKMVPAQVEIAEKLLASFTDEQAELFKQFMENAVEVKIEEEQGNFSEDKSDEDLSPEELAKKYFG